MATVVEEIEAFNRVSSLLEFIFEKFKLNSNIKAIIIGYVWSHKDILIKIDKEAFKLWGNK